MIGGAAAAQIVVVHRRQVVVDQRHGVHHLEGHRRWHGQGAVAACQLTGRQAEDRPQPLATSQQRITHRLAQGLGPLRPQGAIKGRLHPQAGRLQIGGEVKGAGVRRGHGASARGLRASGILSGGVAQGAQERATLRPRALACLCIASLITYNLYRIRDSSRTSPPGPVHPLDPHQPRDRPIPLKAPDRPGRGRRRPGGTRPPRCLPAAW